MYSYERFEAAGCWTVGSYTPDGKWHPESDHRSADAAAARVHYLNGGNNADMLAALRIVDEALTPDDGNEDDIPERCRAALRAARTAIAKAEGRS